MKKTKKIINNLILSTLCISLMLVGLAVPVNAAEQIDTTRKGSLEIKYQPKISDTLKAKLSSQQQDALEEELNKQEVEYKIYKVADVNANGSFTMSNEFDLAAVEINKLDKWALIASDLEAYADTNKIEPDKKDTTKDKICTFEKLTVGAYLVVGDDITLKIDGYDGFVKFVQKAYLVSIPTEVNDELYYDVVANPKYEVVDPSQKKIDIKVLKVWQNNGHEQPESIDVQLLYKENGKFVVYETQELNARNNWRYRWESLDGSLEWKVQEPDVPSGYAVIVEDKKGITYKLVNTYTTTTPSQTTTTPYYPPNSTTRPGESTTTSPEETTTVTDTEITSESVPRGNKTTVSEPEATTSPDDSIPDEPVPEGIPQAGMLWWPVPVLICASVVMFILGVIKNKKA